MSQQKRFEVLSGNPTPDELEAITFAIEHHKREELTPVLRRSKYSIPQLRMPLRHQTNFGFRKGR